MEIEIGEYVIIDKDFRTICIGIGKVVNKNQDTIYVKMSNNNLPISFNINSVTKHSKDKIDLIKEGDYVNGRKVYQVGYNFQDDLVCKMSNSNYEDFIYPKEIKTIVTHEQFASIEYKVEENK